MEIHSAYLIFMCALWNSGNQHKAKLLCWAVGLFNTAVVLSPLAKFKLWPLAFIKYATASYANHNEIFNKLEEHSNSCDFPLWTHDLQTPYTLFFKEQNITKRIQQIDVLSFST